MNTETQRPPQPQPIGKLYDARAIVIATILGSLAAGVYMLYANYRRLGYPKLAVRIAIVGWILYAALVFATSLFPANSPVMVIGFAALQAAIAYGASQLLQGQALAYHAQHKGEFHSTWTAISVGLLAAVVLLVVLVANVFLLNALGFGT